MIGLRKDFDEGPEEADIAVEDVDANKRRSEEQKVNFWGFAAFNSSSKGSGGQGSNPQSKDKVGSIRLEDPQNQEPVVAYFEDFDKLDGAEGENLRVKPRLSEQVRVDIGDERGRDKQGHEELVNSSRSHAVSSDFDEDRIWHEYDRRCAVSNNASAE